MTRDDRLRLGLGVWIAVACVLLLVAPPPPPPPIGGGEDEAIFQRTVDQTVEKTRRWQAERGDRTIAWDEAAGHLAVVITDVGGELHLFEQLLALRHPLGFSVRADAVYTPGVQLRLRGDRRRPREILLHLPCEPALPAEDALVAALARVPGAVGVECGGAAPAGAGAMGLVGDTPVLRERGLFVLDSRTSSRAAVGAAATLTPDMALDEDPAPTAVLAQLERAAQRARDRPTVIIARPSQGVVEALRDGLPRLHRDGIGVYPLREILARRGPASAQ